jgi:hypothetical protein
MLILGIGTLNLSPQDLTHKGLCKSSLT